MNTAKFCYLFVPTKTGYVTSEMILCLSVVHLLQLQFLLRLPSLYIFGKLIGLIRPGKGEERLNIVSIMALSLNSHVVI